MNCKNIKGRQGFTLIELLIVMAVLIIMAGVIVVFQQDLFSLNEFLRETFSIEERAQALLRTMVSEMRTASQSNVGGYAIEIAQGFSLAFYANIDSDPLKERVHYFLDGTTFKKSVVKPAGNPLTYATTTAAEDLRPMLFDVVATTTAPIFSYYDKNFWGTTTPMVQPVGIIDIRLIAIRLIIDKSESPPPAVEVGSQVTIRNLKDNL